MRIATKFLDFFVHSREGTRAIAKVQVLKKYGLLKEAMEEAEKCRDSFHTTSYEKQIAKGYIGNLYGEMKETAARPYDVPPTSKQGDDSSTPSLQ